MAGATSCRARVICRGGQLPALARWLLALGSVATLAANVTADWGCGQSAWPWTALSAATVEAMNSATCVFIVAHDKLTGSGESLLPLRTRVSKQAKSFGNCLWRNVIL